MKKLGKVTPYLFGDHLIISFSKEWLQLFKQIPEFDVILDNKKHLQLISKEEVCN